MAPNKRLYVDKQYPRQLKCNVDSVIINQNHIAIFAHWIYRNPYCRFNLLYRASRDGTGISAFHSKCDNQGATILVAKITNSDQIFGGYNPCCWDSSAKYIPTYDSFIFSFTNKNNLQSAKVGYTCRNEYSMYCHSNYGPTFGGGHDIRCISGSGWHSNNLGNYYPKIDLPSGNFNVDDYEVFQVTKIYM
jgi:hypothetical protein